MTPTLSAHSNHLVVSFEAMACPCEVLVDGNDESVARDILEIAQKEALRVERTFSRYRPDNVVARINAGERVEVDPETAGLLTFADRCHSLSDGLFDITSGVLRRAWTFDGTERAPDEEMIKSLLPLVGWQKVSWDGVSIQLRPGMQIDLGGIGKEYAADRVAALVAARHHIGFLVNLGGDIVVGGRRAQDAPWTVGIEAVDREAEAVRVIELRGGAITTSGDSRKFITWRGKRYGHILDPFSGHPVENSPRSVTVAATTCTEAGFLSTFGMLTGAEAESTLREAGVRFWTLRT